MKMTHTKLFGDLWLCVMKAIGFKLIFVIVLSACTSARPLNNSSITQENLSDLLKKEDVIRVHYKTGERLSLVLDAIEETYLLGHNRKQDIIIIPYQLIEEVKIFQPDTAKTVAISGVGALFIALLIAIGSNGVAF